MMSSNVNMYIKDHQIFSEVQNTLVKIPSVLEGIGLDLPHL